MCTSNTAIPGQKPLRTTQFTFWTHPDEVARVIVSHNTIELTGYTLTDVIPDNDLGPALTWDESELRNARTVPSHALNSDLDSDIGSSLSDDDSSSIDTESGSDSALSRSPTPVRSSKRAKKLPRVEPPRHTCKKKPSPAKENPHGVKSRVDNLLPKLKAANAELERESCEGRLRKRNIENVEDGDGALIEMDLALGVLEEKKAEDEDGVLSAVRKSRRQAAKADQAASKRELPPLLPTGGKRKRKSGIEVVNERR